MECVEKKVSIFFDCCIELESLVYIMIWWYKRDKMIFFLWDYEVGMIVMRFYGLVEFRGSNEYISDFLEKIRFLINDEFKVFCIFIVI